MDEPQDARPTSATSSGHARAEGSPLADLLEDLMRTARALLGAAACSVAMISDDRRELAYVAAAGEGADAVVGMRIPVTRGIAGFVAASGQSITVHDVGADQRFERATAERTGYVPSAMTVVPLRSGGDVIGVLSILDATVDAPEGALGELAATVSRFVDASSQSDGGLTSEATAGAPPTRAQLSRASRELSEQVSACRDLGEVASGMVAAILHTVAEQLGAD